MPEYRLGKEIGCPKHQGYNDRVRPELDENVRCAGCWNAYLKRFPSRTPEIADLYGLFLFALYAMGMERELEPAEPEVVPTKVDDTAEAMLPKRGPGRPRKVPEGVA